MVYVLIGTGLLFVGIGYILTVNNAGYLLSGYNSLSDEERKKVDIESYVAYFKKFHIFLGLSIVTIGMSLYFFDKKAMAIFLGVYPVVAYIFFAWRGRKSLNGLSRRGNNIIIVILTGTLIFVIVLFTLGFREDSLLIDGDKITIEGLYGEVLLPSEIKSIELVERLPKIMMKKNGFALAEVRKGYFKTSDGKTIKLILNSKKSPFILIISGSEEMIYFSAAEKSSKTIFKEIQESFPQINYP